MTTPEGFKQGRQVKAGQGATAVIATAQEVSMMGRHFCSRVGWGGGGVAIETKGHEVQCHSGMITWKG